MSSEADVAPEETECPTCGRDDFASEHGMKSHHVQAHGESLRGIAYECEYCGKEDRKRRSRLEKNEHNFCSVECRSDWRSENIHGEAHWLYSRIDVECEQCGTIKKKMPSEANQNDGNFCSPQCYGEWEAEHYTGEGNPRWLGGDIMYECAWCGVEDTAKQSRINRSKNLFCSPECRGAWQTENWVGEDSPAWQGGWPKYYGEHWNAIADSIRSRDNHTCQLCGDVSGERKHDVHHIIPIRLFKLWDEPNIEDANVARNLITLCRGCHNAVENGSHESPYPPEHHRSK